MVGCWSLAKRFGVRRERSFLNSFKLEMGEGDEKNRNSLLLNRSEVRSMYKMEEGMVEINRHLMEVVWERERWKVIKY